jgi:hypothetical protein
MTTDRDPDAISESELDECTLVVGPRSSPEEARSRMESLRRRFREADIQDGPLIARTWALLDEADEEDESSDPV